MRKTTARGIAAFAALSLIVLINPMFEAHAEPGCPDGLNPPPGAFCSDSKSAGPYRWEICTQFFNWGRNCHGYREAAPGQWIPFPN